MSATAQTILTQILDPRLEATRFTQGQEAVVCSGVTCDITTTAGILAYLAAAHTTVVRPGQPGLYSGDVRQEVISNASNIFYFINRIDAQTQDACCMLGPFTDAEIALFGTGGLPALGPAMPAIGSVQIADPLYNLYHSNGR